MTDPTRLTIQQAADAVGVDPRTVRRWIAGGDVSASKVLQGKREVWRIDASELARFAGSHGHSLTLAAGEDGLDRAKRTGTPSVVDETADGTDGNLAALRAKLDAAERTIAALAQDKEFLQRHLEALTRALPPAPSEVVQAPVTDGQPTVADLGEQIAELRLELEAARAPAPADPSGRRPSWWQRALAWRIGGGG